MPLLTNTVRRKGEKARDPFDNPLNQVFYAKEQANDFPFKMALETYKNLVQNTKSFQELMLFLLEDIIYTSIYATFYEQLLVTAGQNINVAGALVENFQKEEPDREVLISEITNAHFKYVVNHANCKGCDYCQDHSEVDELCEYWNIQDEKFFKTMYVGMMTIQFTMEHLLYDLIPSDPEILFECSEENVLKFRQSIFAFVEQKLQIN
jgi:hypothetical protein